MYDFFQGKLDPKIHPYFEEIHQMRVSAHCCDCTILFVVRCISISVTSCLVKQTTRIVMDEKNAMILPLELSWRVVMSSLLPTINIFHCKNFTNVIMKSYPKITEARIVGHCDISPKRKIDPGQYFDWERYLSV